MKGENIRQRVFRESDLPQIIALRKRGAAISFPGRKLDEKRFGERLSMIFALVFQVLASLVFFSFSSFQFVCLANILWSIGKHLLDSVSLAAGANEAPKEQWGRLLGFFEGISRMGVVVGGLLPLLAISFLKVSHIYFITAVIYAASIIPLLSFKDKVFGKQNLKMSGSARLFLLSALWSVSFEAHTIFLIVAKIQYGIADTAILAIPLVSSIIVGLTSYKIGGLIDRFGFRKSLMASLLAMAALFSGWSLLGGLAILAVYVLLDLSISAAKKAYSAFVNSYIPDSERSAVNVKLVAFGHIGAGLSSLSAGLLWQSLGAAYAFAASVLAVAGMMVVIPVLFRDG